MFKAALRTRKATFSSHNLMIVVVLSQDRKRKWAGRRCKGNLVSSRSLNASKIICVTPTAVSRTDCSYINYLPDRM